MTQIEQLERDIMRLNRAELAALRDWFENYLADEWDRQIEEDAKAGKFDRLAQEALVDHRAGRTKRL
ncbi:MAG: hypothetical protein FJ279_11505 [Planctomycetes bacterium]|nr:hypothetical protein [Planctomycetota bacterium]